MAEQNNALMNAEYYPTIPRAEIAARSQYRIPFKDLEGVGSSFAVAAAEFAKAAVGIPGSNVAGGEGLYRCVFPNGVAGKLAQFKDGSGYLGTIMNNGIEAQARWLPVEGAAVPVAVDPVTIALAVAMMSINHKLNLIQKTQDDIIEFLQQDKESKLEGSVNSLASILKQYKFNSDNPTWRGSQLTIASSIKVEAEQDIIFYRKQVQAVIDEMNKIHVSSKSGKVFEKVNRSFKYYQLCVFLHSYASFLEVLLGGNYKKDYLDHVYKEIKEYSFQYRNDYSNCYTAIEDYMNGSLDAIALQGVGVASKNLGKAIGKIPVVKKGPVDEALIAAGDTLKRQGEKQSKVAMDEFRNNRDAGIRLFTDNIETINNLCNKPVDVLFDDNVIYLCA